jgi:adenine phosphoribosyltransferase
MQEDSMDLRLCIRDVPDFPKPGIIFKDITTLLKDKEAFRHVIDSLAEHYRNQQIDQVVAIESRGFIFGSALAYALGTGFVPVRKPNKLPATKERMEYSLEYGTDCIEIHADALTKGQNALIIDDLLATGGTAAASAKLVEKLGANVAGLGFIIELGFLKGRDRLTGYDVHSLITY